MANKQKDVELFSEILASDKLGSFQNFSTFMSSAYGANDPSAIWEQLKFNPWIAMAIYWDMEEKDAAIYSAIDTRKNNVLSKTRNIIPASDSRQDKKIAAFVEESLERYFVDFESFLHEALDAPFKGVSIGEKIFAEASDRVYIKEVKFKPQHLFSFGETGIAGFSTQSMAYPQTGPLQLRQGVNIPDMPIGGELPEDKFFVFSFRPKYGNRWGDPIDRKAFWQSWIKRASTKEWLRYIEKGSGVVIARYNDGAAEKEMQDAQSAAAAVQEESAVAIPKKFILEVHEMVRNIGSSHKELVDDFCNSEISRIYLGQTLTSRGSDGGGSRALGEVHERVSDKISETDCKALMQAVNNHLIKPTILLNFGTNAACPQWVIEYESKEDLDSKAKRYAVIHKELGMELSKQQIRDDLEIEAPKDKDDTLGVAVEPTAGPNSDLIDDPEVSEFADRSEPGAAAAGQDVKKKVSTALRHAVELEDGTLQAVSPVYDRLLGRVINEIETAGLRFPDLDQLLSTEFQQVSNLLSECTFASYLLAYDTAATECQATIRSHPAYRLLGRYRQTDLSEPGAIATGFFLAEGDDKKKKPVKRRPWRSEAYKPNEKHQTAAAITNGDLSLAAIRFDVPPQEAIDYFKRKRILPADKFYQLEAEARAGAFAIANVYKTDVAEALRDELVSALEKGTPQRKVIKRLKDILAGTGHKMLGDAHLETVFRTASQMAYGVGRRTAQEDVRDLLPMWEYSAVGDDRTRPSHMALDGLMYPANHPFWDKYYPPWDYRCRCTVITTFDYRKGYNPERPNDRSVVTYDRDGLPSGVNVDGQPANLKATNFVGVPRQANLEQVLKDAAGRALDSRKR